MIEPIRALEVWFAGLVEPVRAGRLVLHEGQILFQYDPRFIELGMELSPVRLRLQRDVVAGPPHRFDGLHGLFNDSLPDGWGRLLLDRKLAKQGFDPECLTPLDRLAYVGSRGIGALTYKPEYGAAPGTDAIRLDDLAREAGEILQDKAEAILDRLLALGGSPAGARPKILVGVSADRTKLLHGLDDLPDGFENWLIKFRGGDRRTRTADGLDAGAIEFAYAEMARLAGLDMPETHLFPADRGPGYFGIRRFDRIGNRRVHLHSVSGMLEADHRLPSLTYEALLKLTLHVTRDARAVEQMFRRMVFNVLSCNRDDHTKNFSFLMDASGQWKLAPAYDLTFSPGPGGEHSLTLAGEGRNPTAEHVMKVAEAVGLKRGFATEAIAQARLAVDQWPSIASRCGVSAKSRSALRRRMAEMFLG